MEAAFLIILKRERMRVALTPLGAVREVPALERPRSFDGPDHRLCLID
jgi:hypothetical protein